jgi:hypothetical protein
MLTISVRQATKVTQLSVVLLSMQSVAFEVEFLLSEAAPEIPLALVVVLAT